MQFLNCHKRVFKLSVLNADFCINYLVRTFFTDALYKCNHTRKVKIMRSHTMTSTYLREINFRVDIFSRARFLLISRGHVFANSLNLKYSHGHIFANGSMRRKKNLFYTFFFLLFEYPMLKRYTVRNDSIT